MVRAPGAGGWQRRPQAKADTCCLPSRHSLNGACFCAVKSCSCCARSTRAGGCSRESDMRMVLVLLPSKVQRKPRRCRGCFVPFFRKKVPKNSPADAFAYFVPSNVRNGRLFAGLQANRPRFLPLLAGTSFRGSGIGPESFAAVLSFRPGEQANRGEHPLFACSCRILP